MKKKQTILIASDHAGYELKKKLIQNMKSISWVDLGPNTNQRVDYPDFAFKLAKKLTQKPSGLGILICGSGIGMSISANKVKGIRAATVESELTAKLTAEHNKTNVLCLGARILSPAKAQKIINTWLNAKFEGGRHLKRLKKISKFEKENCK